MLAIRTVSVGRSYLPALFLWWASRHRFDGDMALGWDILFAAYTLARIISIGYDWWYTRYQLTDTGIRLSTGGFVRDEVHVAWHEVAAVQVSRSLLHVRLKCALVQIGIGSQGKRQRLTLEAVPDDVADRIAASVSEHSRQAVPQQAADAPASVPNGPQVGSPDEPSPAAPADMAGDLIYRMRPVDYLMVSITYGQVFLVVPFAFGAYSEASRYLPLPEPDLLRVVEGPPPAWLLLAALLTLIPAAITYGSVVAWLRYRSFQVRSAPGVFTITGGYMSRESRTVQQSSVRGLIVEQNPLMLAMGYGRLSLVAREAGSTVNANLLFPTATLKRLSEAVDHYFPAYAGMFERRPHGRSSVKLLVVTGIAGVATAFAAVLLAQQWRPGMAVVILLAAPIVLFVLLNRQWTSLSVDEQRQSIHFRRGFLWVRRYAIPGTAVHVARASQGPAGRRSGVWTVSLDVYDGRHVRLRAFGCPDELVGSVRGAMLAQAPSAPRDLGTRLRAAEFPVS